MAIHDEGQGLLLIFIHSFVHTIPTSTFQMERLLFRLFGIMMHDDAKRHVRRRLAV